MPAKKHPEEESMETFTMSLEKNMDKWLEEHMENTGNRSKASAIRQCITVARNVLEYGSGDDIRKYVYGKDLKKTENEEEKDN